MTQRVFRILALVAALTGLAVTVCAGPAHAQAPRAERPTYKVGDTWIRSDGTYTLTRIEKDLYVFTSGTGNEISLSKDLGIASIVLNGKQVFDLAEAPGPSWPLEVGRWGSAPTRWRAPMPRAIGGFSGNVGVTWKVEAREPVRVEAGEFLSLRVSYVFVSGPGHNFSQTVGGLVLWYAPSVQRFVKAQSDLPGLRWELTGSGLALSAERPTYKVGDTWVRSDGTYTLGRIENDRYVFTSGTGNEISLSRDLGIASIVLDGRQVFDLADAPAPSWPLEVGKWGSVRTRWRAPLPKIVPAGFSGTVHVGWRVEASEPLRVPAGEFTTFRVSYVLETPPASGLTANVGRFVVWYAPDLQRFVKAQSDLPGLTWEVTGVERPAPPVIAAPPAPAPSPPPAAVVQPAPPAVRAPPTLTLLDPKPGTLLRTDQATLRIEVKSDTRLKSLVVKGRGGDKSFAPEPSARAGEPWTVEATVPLAEGNNVLRLEAVDEFGGRAAETVILARQSLIAVQFEGPAGATVSVDQDRHALDAQGRLGLQLAPGTYRVEASKEGFILSRQTLRLTPGQGKALHKLALVQAVPPTIALLDPKPGAVLRTADAKLKVEVRSRYRLGALRVGKENEVAQQTFAPSASAKPGETWTVEALVLLGEGDNKFRLEAVDEHGTRAEQRVTLTRQSLVAAPPPPPLPPPPAAATPVDTEAPKIAINYPPPDTKVESESLVVLGLVSDNVGVDRVQITVNGVEVKLPRDVGGVGRGVPIRVPTALQLGNNLIEITAADKAGNVAQVVRTVTRVSPATAAIPGPKIVNRWAVVVGVGDYEHRDIPRLRFAARDAEAMHQFLTTQGGYPKDHVLLFTDHTPQKPTLLNIKRALGDFLARRAGRDDMVLIYFAGHGAPELDMQGAESDGLAKYLIPRDSDPDSLYTTALPMDEIQKIFARVQAERIVMLLDTCYSGTAGGRTFARPSVRASGLNDQFLERLTRSKGRIIITASGPNEVAIEDSRLGHGLFTYYVLEGLRGKADRNGDGIVTVSELYEYVEDQVDSAARLAGGRQRPLMKGEIEGTLPLSRVGGR